MFRSNQRLVLCLGLAAPLAAAALAGGGEVFCNGGNEVVEAWRNVPAGGIPWTLNQGPSGTAFAPGYELINCVVGSFPSANLEDIPGAQSIFRAAETFEDATDPVTGAPMTTIAMNDIPSTLVWQYIPPFTVPSFLTQADGINLITMWEPESTFTWLGGPTVVAATLVSVDMSTGDILEADIAFQCLSRDANGVPYWSFVEENALTGRTNSSMPVGVTSWVDPLMGYADLEGIAVHEMGHFLGLGHSLVDGPASPVLGTSPTMFETGHTIAYSGAVSFRGSGCGLQTAAFDTANAPLGGLLGHGARTLESDDRSAIGALYPSASFGSQLGAVTGQIVDQSGAGLAGVHVMAVKSDTPNLNRVGTLSRSNGQYTLEGLEPGTWYVLVESVDKGGFFDPATLPNYVDNSTSACVPSVPRIQAEAWNTGEDWFPEVASPMVASAITVSAGATTANIDVKVVDTFFAYDTLTVRDLAAPTSVSSRGIRLAPNPGVNPTIELRIDDDPAWTGQTVFLVIVPERKNLLFNGELGQVSDTSAFAGFPLILSKTLDTNGDANFSFTLANNVAHFGFGVQSFILRPDSTIKVSNLVSVFLDRP